MDTDTRLNGSTTLCDALDTAHAAANAVFTSGFTATERKGEIILRIVNIDDAERFSTAMLAWGIRKAGLHNFGVQWTATDVTFTFILPQ